MSPPKNGNGSDGITPEAWEALMRLLGATPEEAGDNYQRIRLRLIRLFEWRGCEFPEDLTDVTFNRVARRIAEGVVLETQDPSAYFYGVAHHVYKEVLRKDPFPLEGKTVSPPKNGNGSDGITPEAWEALMRLLGDTPEEAGDNYQRIRLRLIRLFEWRGCEFPEDLADITFNRVARRIAEGVVLERQDPSAYFYGVAHHVYKEVLRKDNREQRMIERRDWPPPVPPEEEEDHRLESLRHCLQGLDPEQRDLLLRYHQGDNNIRARKQLCDELHIGMNALRIRVHRLRRRLATCIEERLRG